MTSSKAWRSGYRWPGSIDAIRAFGASGLDGGRWHQSVSGIGRGYFPEADDCSDASKHLHAAVREAGG